jgi:SAM-dependent methyltransferase
MSDWHSWLDHPLIAAHYGERALIDGRTWDAWVAERLGEAPARTLELGCGSGARSFQLLERRHSQWIDGIDPSETLIAEAERSRRRAGAPGEFRVADLNACRLQAAAYDVVLASHSLHQVTALERLFDQVYEALTPRGVFVVEGFVGPSRLQWTDAQIALAKTALSWLPERLRFYRSGVLKTWEARPDRDAVTALSLFDAIRSAEIRGLLERRFEPVAVRPLGGTLQNLIYSGIVHNFGESDAEASRGVQMIAGLEDTLIDTGLVPSDFMLIVGRRR